MQIIKRSPKALSKAIAAVKKGGVVICPTDTVYGFIADAGRKKAVGNIFKIKKRPASKPLPIFVTDLKMAKSIAEIDEKQEKILKKYWPGKYTFVLKSKGKKLHGISKDTVAIRIPKYSFLNALLKKMNRPLVQTSVNISNQKPLMGSYSIVKAFGKNRAVYLLVDAGDLKKALPSTVYDISKGELTKVR